MCNIRVGDRIHMSGGKSFFKVGNQVYCNNGIRYQKKGNRICGSDGSSATVLGNSQFVPNGNHITIEELNCCNSLLSEETRVINSFTLGSYDSEPENYIKS